MRSKLLKASSISIQILITIILLIEFVILCNDSSISNNNVNDQRKRKIDRDKSLKNSGFDHCKKFGKFFERRNLKVSNVEKVKGNNYNSNKKLRRRSSSFNAVVDQLGLITQNLRSDSIKVPHHSLFHPAAKSNNLDNSPADPIGGNLGTKKFNDKEDEKKRKIIRLKLLLNLIQFLKFDNDAIGKNELKKKWDERNKVLEESKRNNDRSKK